MDRKIELEVLNITNSQVQAGAFALLLGEVNGTRKLPIIIGPAEAQATALYLKGVHTPRPLTHDLFMTSLSAVGAHLIEVVICSAIEGVFHSIIYLQGIEQAAGIDARTSDAIALAVRAKCPILIYESLLEKECIHLFDETKKDFADEINELEQLESERRNRTSLEKKLSDAIRQENYEQAAIIRDQLEAHKRK